MQYNTRMSRYDVSTTSLALDLGSGASKVILKAGAADIRIAYDYQNFSNNQYFTLEAGTTLILDQPVPTQSQLVYVYSLAASVLEVWIT